MRFLSIFWAILFLFSSFVPGLAQECTDDGLEQSIKLYEEGKFDKAAQELRNYARKYQGAPKDEPARDCLFKANFYAGMAYVGLRKEREARERFTEAARAKPCKPLDPVIYPPDTISLYEKACEDVRRFTRISVRSNLPGAEVFVDDLGVGRTPLTGHNVSPGQHTVRAVFGSEKKEQVRIVEPGQQLELLFEFRTLGGLHVSSEPGSANISLDGTLLKIKTPGELSDCPAGEHTLVISKEGFADFTRKVNVKPNEVTRVQVQLERLTYAVKVTSIPDGADVVWDEVPKGKTPLVIQNVTSGTHKISVSKESFEQQAETIEVRNASVERAYRLNQYTGTIVIHSEPSGAQVFIDEKYAGATPFQGKYPPKDYSLRLKKEGYKERTTTFAIARNKETRLDEKLWIIDTRPPEVVVQPVETIIRENKYHVKAAVTDNQLVGEVTLAFRSAGERNFQKIGMAMTGKDLYAAVISDLYLKKDASIEYYLIACDAQQNCTESGGRDAPYRARVISLEPYTEGYVLDMDKDRKTVAISLGALDGIGKEDSLYVFRLGQRYTDPKTGELLSIREELVGIVKVSEAMPRTASAVIKQEFPGVSPVGKNDRVRKRVGPPTDIRTEGTYANKIVLRWSPSREPEAKGYALYRSSTPDGQFERLGEVSGRDNTAYEDGKEVRENITYYYRVAAVNDLGTVGVLSDRCTGKTKKGVLAPEYVKAEPGTFREIILRWDIAKQDPDIGDYVIYRSDTEGGEFQPIREVSRRTDEYSDKENLVDGRTYYYRVAGKSIYGAVGDLSKVVPVKTKGGPIPPRNVRALSNMAKMVKIEWEEPDREVVGYRLLRKESEDGTPHTFARTRDRDLRDTDVTDGKKYYYCVSGYYRFKGEEIYGDCSPFVSAVSRKRPETPTGFSGQSGLVKQVKLKWDKSSNKEITEYRIHRRREGEESKPVLVQILKGLRDTLLSPNERRVGADTSELTDAGLLDGTVYHFKLKAVDAERLESDWTNEITVQTKPLPAAPVGLKARVEGGKAILTWDPNSEKDVVGYKVFRKSDYLSTVKSTTFEAPIREESKMEFAVTAVDSAGLESTPSTVEVELKKER
jgi:fibronectin type 3 domain-containing protein